MFVFLVFIVSILLLDNLETSDDIEILEAVGISETSNSKETSSEDSLTSEVTLEGFRSKTINEDLTRQRFTVSREDGWEELKKDILCCYKNSQVKLTAKPKVKFEGEAGMGSGPIREFLLSSMKLVEDGIEKEGKPLLFFEAEENHKIPLHDQALRCTGAFRAIGRIIGHSLLHGGPVLYGLSRALVGYWVLTANGKDDDLMLESLPLSLNDIPDIDLRNYLTKVK